MSCEGQYEFLCSNGHFWAIDFNIFFYGDKEKKEKAHICPHCSAKAKYSCCVDVTNGYNQEGDPESFSGPLIDDGFEDVPQQDHHGNKYFTKLFKYKPDLSKNRWNEIKE